MGRIIDLSLRIDSQMRGVEIQPAKDRKADGWNATTLSLYSHCGTHMDAPRHFLDHGDGIDQQALESCIGPARLLDLTPVEPKEAISIERLSPWVDQIGPGDRLLFRTDWSKRYGTEEYRDALPRISLELADWLVERSVALIGVEPPSVADVNNLAELTAVHEVLLEGNVIIIEGLTNLDRIQNDPVELIALPLKIHGGDGSPVRAVVIER